MTQGQGLFILFEAVEALKLKPSGAFSEIKKVLRGELLVEIPEHERQNIGGGQPLNYHLFKEPNTLLYSDEEGVEPLGEDDFKLLEAISSPSDRYAVFTHPTKLEWGANLQRGSRVYVTMPPINQVSVDAIVRYRGDVDSLSGTNFRVEIMDPHYRGQGSTDGVFRGIEYFQCEQDCGLFVALNKLPAPLLRMVPPSQHSQMKTVDTVAKPRQALGIPRSQEDADDAMLLAESLGTTRTKLMAEQREALKQAEEAKEANLQRKREDERKQAMGEAIYIAEQRRLFEQLHMIPPFSSANHNRSHSPERQGHPQRAKIPPPGKYPNNLDLTPQQSPPPHPTVKYADFPRASERKPPPLPQKSLPPNPDDLPRPVVNRMELEMMHSNSRSVLDQGTRGPQLKSVLPVGPPWDVNEDKYKFCQIPRSELEQVHNRLDIANLELAEIKGVSQQLRKQLESANVELMRQEDSNQRLSREVLEVKDANQQFTHTNLEQTKTIQLLSQQLETANTELAKFHTERSSSDIEPWKVACSKVEKGAEIARGGWGTISKGKVSVAIKELHGAIAHQSSIDQFCREMQILSQVRHTNLVQFIGAVFDQPSGAPRAIPLIIIELLDTNLRSAYEKGQLRADHKLPIFKDVAKALKYLHERYDPIIHRDVSAPNVLLEALPGGKWKGKLSDLGSANYLKHAKTEAPGAILYAAPETFPTVHNPNRDARRMQRQTFKIDVFSFGVTLCEVMTSQLPTEEDYEDMLRQVQRACLPIYDLIRQCTEYKQENRPEMAVVLTTLDDVRYP